MALPTTITALAGLVAVATLAPLSAQNLIGYGTGGGLVPTVQEYDFANCQFGPRCAPAGFPAPFAADAGGTAYDPIHSGVWISDGRMIARVAADSCDYQCRPTPYPGSVTNAYVTGLAFRESRGQLFILDSVGQLTVVVERNCQLSVVSRCRIASSFPTVAHWGGLAVDEVTGQVLVTATLASGAQHLLLLDAANPCRMICSVRIRNCLNSPPLGTILGLAHDPCDGRVYFTDGVAMVSAHLGRTGGNCVLAGYRCCNAGITLSRFHGLCIRPKGVTSHGRSCTNGTCPTCPSMEQVVVGDTSLGNPGLRFRLINAPRNANAFLALGAGSCTNGGPTLWPLCGPILVPSMPIPPIIVGPFPTGVAGTAPCDGVATVPVPVPLDPALCGDRFSTQFILLCRRTLGFGTGLSNCISFQITGT